MNYQLDGITLELIKEWQQCTKEAWLKLWIDTGLWDLFRVKATKWARSCYYRFHNQNPKFTLEEIDIEEASARAICKVWDEFKKPEINFENKEHFIGRFHTQCERRVRDFVNEEYRRRIVTSLDKPVENGEEITIEEILKDEGVDVEKEAREKRLEELVQELINSFQDTLRDPSPLKTHLIQLKKVLQMVDLFCFLKERSWGHYNISEEVISGCCGNENTYSIHNHRLRGKFTEFCQGPGKQKYDCLEQELK
ncbi:hypothetical protein M1N05_01645 [Dehalococcoidales bacterium]|nr:hypothetical protein [Dehalococcoidales bacterium]